MFNVSNMFYKCCYTVRHYLCSFLIMFHYVLFSGKTNILFLLFNGETFDYIGSQRMLYDMLNDDFPVDGLGPNNNILPLIKPADIKLYVELSQMGNYKNNLYIHYLKEHSVVRAL